MESVDKPKIKVSKNGPYIIKGLIPLEKQTIVTDDEGYPIKWYKGKKYSLQKFYSLCRCGQSKHKPFCDGTHLKINFDGSETANQEPYINQAKDINGPNLRLTDAFDLCARARFC